VPVGGVEGSKLCLFSVIMPAKCVSSISPRFHYRRLPFCFLPLPTILESSWCTLLIPVFETEIRGLVLTDLRPVWDIERDTVSKDIGTLYSYMLMG
jgi:hypothetical protein